MRIISSILFVLIILLFGCRESKTNEKKITTGSERQKIIISKSDSNSDPSQMLDSFKIYAYLIYNDGTLSSFDILNDKSIALWNVIIGGGDAIKPSDSIKLSFLGNMNNLKIKIRNGDKVVNDSVILHSKKNREYIIKNTGCAEVYIDVFKNNRIIFRDTIPFHCGE